MPSHPLFTPDNFSWRRTRAKLIALVLFSVLIALSCLLRSQAQGPAMSGGSSSQTPTTWRPNKSDAKYAGSQACVKCHADEAATQHATAMGKAAQTVDVSDVLRSNARLTYRSEPYSYEIIRRGDQSLYTVTDGTTTISEPILYSFGQGKAGQTYIFRHNGSLYETRVSFYKELRGLDWTMGYQLARPTSLDDAAGRALRADETREGFGRS